MKRRWACPNGCKITRIVAWVPFSGRLKVRYDVHDTDLIEETSSEALARSGFACDPAENPECPKCGSQVHEKDRCKGCGKIKLLERCDPELNEPDENGDIDWTLNLCMACWENEE